MPAHVPSLAEIDQILNELAEELRADARPEDVAQQLVSGLQAALQPAGAAVWTVRQGEVAVVCEQGVSGCLTSPEDREAHEHLLRLALRSRRGQRCQLPAGSQRRTLLLAPFFDELDQPLGLLEIVCDWTVSADEAADHGELLGAFAELAAEHHRRRRLRELAEAQHSAAALERFLLRLHQSLDLRKTWLEVANSLPALCGAERTLAVGRRRGGWRLLASTGVAEVDPRSATARAASRVAALAANIGEPLWETAGQPQERGEPLDAALASYIDLAHPRALAVWPLPDAQTQTCHSAVLVEWHDGAPDSSQREILQRAASQIAVAVGNAERHASVPLRRLLSPLSGRWWRSRWPAVAWLTTAVVAAVLAAGGLLLVEADFTVEARGQLQPLRRREVFAPQAGYVQRVDVTHGEQVQSGDPLLLLRNVALERDLAQYDADLQAMQTERQALRLAQLGETPQTAAEMLRAEQSAAQEKDLDQRIASTQTLRSLAQQQLDSLRIVSPLAGRVVSWDLVREIDQRTVVAGQRLLRIDDLDGPWHLELSLPEADIRHLTRRQRENPDEPLVVQFILASEPQRKRQGTVTRIAGRAETSADGQQYLALDVAVRRDELPAAPRAGATTVARIQCGRRPLGFLWFHRLIDLLRQKMFW